MNKTQMKQKIKHKRTLDFISSRSQSTLPKYLPSFPYFNYLCQFLFFATKIQILLKNIALKKYLFHLYNATDDCIILFVIPSMFSM